MLTSQNRPPISIKIAGIEFTIKVYLETPAGSHFLKKKIKAREWVFVCGDVSPEQPIEVGEGFISNEDQDKVALAETILSHIEFGLNSRRDDYDIWRSSPETPDTREVAGIWISLDEEERPYLLEGLFSFHKLGEWTRNFYQKVFRVETSQIIIDHLKDVMVPLSTKGPGFFGAAEKNEGEDIEFEEKNESKGVVKIIPKNEKDLVPSDKLMTELMQIIDESFNGIRLKPTVTQPDLALTLAHKLAKSPYALAGGSVNDIYKSVELIIKESLNEENTLKTDCRKNDIAVDLVAYTKEFLLDKKGFLHTKNLGDELSRKLYKHVEDAVEIFNRGAAAGNIDKLKDDMKKLIEGKLVDRSYTPWMLRDDIVKIVSKHVGGADKDKRTNLTEQIVTSFQREMFDFGRKKTGGNRQTK